MDQKPVNKQISSILIPMPQYIKAQLRAQEEQRKLYGHVRDIIHADFQGQKFVAVGHRLFHSEKWKTFPDFLFDYIKNIFGSDWGNAELAEPLMERHQIMQWYQHVWDLRRQQQPDKVGRYDAVPDGISAAYLLLSYDLYLLSHHSSLQKHLVKRLKQPTQFQGARYELFVASTLIRAGCEIAFEDEEDETRKHVEFIATHKTTNQRVAIEAKSKHRHGILGFQTPNPPVDQTKANVRGLIEDAVNKSPADPLIIFVELNFPPTDIGNVTWLEDVKADVHAVTKKRNGVAPFDLLVFSNIPHHYGMAGSTDPVKLFYMYEPVSPRASGVRREIIDAIEIATKQYGTIPNEFPE